MAEKDNAKLLSNLHEIGVMLSAFIYDIPENAGYGEFYSKCKSVLDTLKKHSLLIDKLVKSYNLFRHFKCCIYKLCVK